MKNKFILTSALAISLMLTGCGGGNTGETAPADNAVDTVADTVADTAADTVADTIADTAADSAADLSESAAADTEEPEAAAEDETDSANGSNAGNFGETDKFYGGVFHGNGYTLKIDGDTWVDISAMMDYVRQAANDSDIDFGIDFTDEQYNDAYDGMFICPDSEGANFNMTVVDIGMDLNIDAEGAELYGAIIEQQYAAVEGCTFYGCGIDSAGGYDCLKAELEMTSSGVTLRMVQYCFWENKMQMVITFTATPDEYEKMFPEFKKVLDSVSFEG